MKALFLYLFLSNIISFGLEWNGGRTFNPLSIDKKREIMINAITRDDFDDFLKYIDEVEMEKVLADIVSHYPKPLRELHQFFKTQP